MVRKTSVTLIVFAIINIVLALIPPCVGCNGLTMLLQVPHMPIGNRDLGPPLFKHIEKELPSAKWEAIGAVTCNSFVSLLLIGGAVDMLMGREWGRWVTVGAAVLMILALCIHDVYHLAVFQPSIWDFFDKEMPVGGPPGEREGAKVGASVYSFWSCANVLLMVYLFAMSTCAALIKASYEIVDEKQRLLGAFDDHQRGDPERSRGERAGGNDDRAPDDEHGFRDRDRS